MQQALCLILLRQATMSIRNRKHKPAATKSSRKALDISAISIMLIALLKSGSYPANTFGRTRMRARG